MACAAGEGCLEFVLSGCRFGKRVLAHGRWPVPSVSEWPGSLHISFGGCRLEDPGGATPGQMSLGREGLRDRAEWSGVTAVGATNASDQTMLAGMPRGVPESDPW